MRRDLFPASLFLLGLAGCAANGDAPPDRGAPPAAPNAAAAAPVESRDVAILVLEQTGSSLRVVSSARRPRSAFGPSAMWNGRGAPTHRWALLGAGGETLASGSIAARGAVEIPPDPRHGVPGAHVPLASLAFDARVPQPAPGETIEITSVSDPAITARWP